MPQISSTECTNCGHTIPDTEERCPHCNMYIGEDPEQYQKYLTNLDNELGE